MIAHSSVMTSTLNQGSYTLNPLQQTLPNQRSKGSRQSIKSGSDSLQYTLPGRSRDENVGAHELSKVIEEKISLGGTLNFYEKELLNDEQEDKKAMTFKNN